MSNVPYHNTYNTIALRFFENVTEFIICFLHLKLELSLAI